MVRGGASQSHFVLRFSLMFLHSLSPTNTTHHHENQMLPKGVCCIIYCRRITDFTTFLVVWGSGENHVRKSWWNANPANFVFLYSLLVVSRTWTEVDWCVALSLLNTNSSIPALQRHFWARLSTRLVLMQKGVGARLDHTPAQYSDPQVVQD